MKTVKFFSLLMMIFLLSNCAKDYLNDPEDQFLIESNDLKSSEAKLKIVVVSDFHYMDESLLPVAPENNPEFQAMLFSNYYKMVEMSSPICSKALSEIKKDKPDVVLVPGDMAFNGELYNHEIVSSKLQELAEAGIQVLVVPGNNDINSPDALSYVGTGSAVVPNISSSDFVSIYGRFGYDDALYRDVNSLSYIFKLRDNLWVLGIDACIYEPVNKRSGEINANTMFWIQDKMAEANEKGIIVLAMMHHGIGEHYPGQSKVFKGDVVNDYNAAAASLMAAGIRFVFTGHSHANDIVEVSDGERSLFDIETGSLITPLSPYRVVTINDNFLKVETKRITDVDVTLPKGESFIDYSTAYLTEHLDLFFTWYLVVGFKLPPELAEKALPYLRNAIMAQYAGDEKLLPTEERNLEALSELFPPDNKFMPIIYGLWNDPYPDDGRFQFKLK